MTDLPEKLREIAETYDEWSHPVDGADTLRQAADEIERLRDGDAAWQCRWCLAINASEATHCSDCNSSRVRKGATP